MSYFKVITFILFGLFSSGRLYAYNCDSSCKDQSTECGFLGCGINPGKFAVCDAYQMDNCWNVGKAVQETVCGNAGAASFGTLAEYVRAKNSVLPKESLDHVAKAVLRPIFGSLVDTVRVIYGASTLDSFGIGGMRIPAYSTAAQTFGNEIYITKWRSDYYYDYERIELIGHEMLHTVQYRDRDYSWANFGRDYFNAWCKNYSYDKSYLENDAEAVEPLVRDSYEKYLTLSRKPGAIICNDSTKYKELLVSKSVNRVGLSLIPMISTIGMYSIPRRAPGSTGVDGCFSIHQSQDEETIQGLHIIGIDNNGLPAQLLLTDPNGNAVDPAFGDKFGNKLCIDTDDPFRFPYYKFDDCNDKLGGKMALVTFQSIPPRLEMNPLSKKVWYQVDIKDNVKLAPPIVLTKLIANPFEQSTNAIATAFQNLHGFELYQNHPLRIPMAATYFTNGGNPEDIVRANNSLDFDMTRSMFVSTVNSLHTIDLPIRDKDGDTLTIVPAPSNYYPDTYSQYIDQYSHLLPCSGGGYSCIPKPVCGIYAETSAPSTCNYTAPAQFSTMGALHGTVTLDTVNRRILYMPPTGGQTRDGFSLQVTDSLGKTEKIFFTIRISPSALTLKGIFTEVMSRAPTSDEEVQLSQMYNESPSDSSIRSSLTLRKTQLYNQCAYYADYLYRHLLSRFDFLGGVPDLAYEQIFADALSKFGMDVRAPYQAPAFDTYVEAEKYEKSIIAFLPKLNTPITKHSCDGTAHADTGQVIRYLASTVEYNQLCQSEVQTATCRDGQWINFTGSYQFLSCSVLPPPDSAATTFYDGKIASSIFPGPYISIRTNAPTSEITEGDARSARLSLFTESENQTATAGLKLKEQPVNISNVSRVWFEARADVPMNVYVQLIDRWGRYSSAIKVEMSDSYRIYSLDVPEVTNGLSFEKTEAVAIEFQRDLPVGNHNVYVQHLVTNYIPASCGDIPSGSVDFRWRYKSPTAEQMCEYEFQTAVCMDGALGPWSGTYVYDTCTQPLTCGDLLHNQTETRIRYQSATAPVGTSCIAETQSRTCNNGDLPPFSGSYQQTSCTESRYKYAFISASGVCQSEIQYRTASEGNYGNWSGTFTLDSCVESRTRYQTDRVAYGSTCQSQVQTRTFANGNTPDWTGTYTYTSCTVDPPANCGTVTHGSTESRLMYQSTSGTVCLSETQTRTCVNGAFGNWTGTYTYSSCQVISANTDSDGDGIADSVDRCPGENDANITSKWVDNDLDGFWVKLNNQCPSTAGFASAKSLLKSNGEPYAIDDNDGVPAKNYDKALITITDSTSLDLDLDGVTNENHSVHLIANPYQWLDFASKCSNSTGVLTACAKKLKLVQDIDMASISLNEAGHAQIKATCDMNSDGDTIDAGDTKCLELLSTKYLASAPERNTWFTGIIDGSGYSFKNLRVNLPTSDQLGALIRAPWGAVIRDINLHNISINGRDKVGAVAGWFDGGVLKGVTTRGHVKGRARVGGVAGEVSASNTTSYPLRKVTALMNLATVQSVYTDLCGVGGVFGVAGNEYPAISMDLLANHGEIQAGSCVWVAGLVGLQGNQAKILNSYNVGRVAGRLAVGGISGLETTTAKGVSNVYSSGIIVAVTSAGFIVGEHQSTSALTGFYLSTATISGGNDGVGKGVNSSTSAKTSTQLKTMTTYSGASWSISATGATTVWYIEQGASFAALTGLKPFYTACPSISAVPGKCP